MTVAIIFFISGISKILSPEGAENYIKLLLDQTVYHSVYAKIVVYCIGFSEMMLSIIIFNKNYFKITIGVFITLIIMFTLSILSFPLRSLSIPHCGCFGELIPSGSIEFTIIRNIIILSLLISLRYFTILNEKAVKSFR